MSSAAKGHSTQKMDGPHSDHFQVTEDAGPASDESRGVSSKQPGPLEDTFGRPDINIHQLRNAVEGLRFMGPQGDEYHQDVEVPHPQPRREERDLFLSRPPGRYAAQEEARAKQPKVMPDQYDGKTSWLDYLAHFEICSDINGWNRQQCTQYLSVSLRGMACQVMCSMPAAKRHDYTELVAALGRRFNPQNQNELFRVQLRNRTRKSNETLPELGQDLKSLVYRAYPTATTELLDTLGKDHFIDAINDEDIRWRVYQSKPMTLDDAICSAVELEAYKRAEEQRNGRRRPVREISRRENQPKGQQQNRVQTRGQHAIDDIDKELRELKEKLFALQKRRGDLRQNSTGCWHCGQEGHFRYQCPQLHPQTSNLN